MLLSPLSQTNTSLSAAVRSTNETLTLIEWLCVLPLTLQSPDRSAEIVRVCFRPKPGPQ